MKLDSFDIKILSQLDYDARQSYMKIGKKINRSKQFVFYRVNNLVKGGLIKGYASDFDTRKLGYNIFSIFIQFQKTNKKKEETIIQYLRKSPSIGYCLRVLGNWDLFLSVKAETIGLSSATFGLIALP